MYIDRRTDEDFTIILPTLNEAENIAPMIERISHLYPCAKVLVMDDRSSDETVSRVRALNRPPEQVRAIVRDANDRGLTASVMDGILQVQTKYFIVLDADFQHPPESISGLMVALQNGHDLAIGVREDKMNLMWARKLASGGAHFLAKSYLTLIRQPGSKDTMSGFFGGDTAIFQKVVKERGSRFERKGFKVLFDLLKFAPRDVRIEEVMFTFNARRGGESKLNSRIILSILRQCGFFGKSAAVAATFFLMTSGGRFVAAVLLGLMSTFAIISLTGGDAWTSAFTSYTLFSLIFALIYMVMASEFIMRWRGESIIRGLSLVSVVFSAYTLNLAIFYWLAEILPDMQVIASLLGFAIAFGFDTSLGFKRSVRRLENNHSI